VAYSRLRETLSAKEVRDEQHKAAALDALRRAKSQLAEPDLIDLADESGPPDPDVHRKDPPA